MFSSIFLQQKKKEEREKEVQDKLEEEKIKLREEAQQRGRERKEKEMAIKQELWGTQAKKRLIVLVVFHAVVACLHSIYAGTAHGRPSCTAFQLLAHRI